MASDSNQRLLGPSENALMRASQRFQGYLKVGVIIHLHGPIISLERLSRTRDRLQRRYPVLQSRLLHNPNEIESFLLQRDDKYRLPIREIARKRDEHLSYWCEEWRKHEKESVVIGQGVAEIWLLQDPNDNDGEVAPREIVLICEHGMCDGLSLTTVANELMMMLSDDSSETLDQILDWPKTMEQAIEETSAALGEVYTMEKCVQSVQQLEPKTHSIIARIPVASVDFPLNQMERHCHTEFVYGTLSKEETQRLVQRCREKGTTVTSAISSAIIVATSTLFDQEDKETTAIIIAVGADTRRRCVPPVPTHDLSYHVSGIFRFKVPINDVPTTSDEMWKLAVRFREHVQTSLNAGQAHAIGLMSGKLLERNLSTCNLPELPTVGISSWGILPFRERYEPWALTNIVSVVNMIRAVTPFITVQTVNGVLTTMFMGGGPVLPLIILEDLCDNTMKELRQMIDE